MRNNVEECSKQWDQSWSWEITVRRNYFGLWSREVVLQIELLKSNSRLSSLIVVTTSDDRKKSKMKVSTDLVCHYWILRIKFNKSLSLSIIRLANYSVTTSLIYEFLL